MSILNKKLKLMVNVVNLDQNGVQIIWLIKLKILESLGCDIYLNSADFTKKIELKNEDIYNFNKKLKNDLNKSSVRKISKFGYIFYASLKNLKALVNIKRILKEQFDLMYTPSSVLDLVVLPFVLKIVNRKVLWVTVFDNTVPLRGAGNKIIRFLAWFFFQISILLLKKADLVYTIMPYLKDYLIQRGFDPHRIILTGCAVETDLICKSHVKKKSLDAIFMGRINEKKGIYDMLEVLKLVKNQIPDFSLGILGEGDVPTEHKFRTKIKKLGLSKNIHFFGHVKGIKKYQLIKSSKLFWFFSHDESFGVALLEAICCGVPAMAYPLKPFVDLYKHNEIIIFKFGDYRSIANKTLEMYRNKQIVNKSGEKLISKFRWENIVKIEFNSFNKLVNK